MVFQIIKLSNTVQRRIILEELNKLKTHPTADELYIIVRARLPQISLGTVYRNLDQLSAAGAIQKLEIAGKQKRFDGQINRHYHIRCTKCDCVEDIPDEEMTEIDRKLSEIIESMQFEGYRLELNGKCSKCSRKR